jgi:hypothetical protein
MASSWTEAADLNTARRYLMKRWNNHCWISHAGSNVPGSHGQMLNLGMVHLGQKQLN